MAYTSLNSIVDIGNFISNVEKKRPFLPFQTDLYEDI